jgi:hypothetical protein
MAEKKTSKDAKDDTSGESIKIPAMQRLLDNPFLLLFIGVVMPTLLYLLWGVMELTQIPIAK